MSGVFPVGGCGLFKSCRGFIYGDISREIKFFLLDLSHKHLLDQDAILMGEAHKSLGGGEVLEGQVGIAEAKQLLVDGGDGSGRESCHFGDFRGFVLGLLTDSLDIGMDHLLFFVIQFEAKNFASFAEQQAAVLIVLFDGSIDDLGHVTAQLLDIDLITNAIGIDVIE